MILYWKTDEKESTMTKTKSVVTTHNVFGTLLNFHMSQFSSSVKMMELNYTSDEVPASLEIFMWLWNPGGNVYINQYISENINRTCNTQHLCWVAGGNVFFMQEIKTWS